MPMSFVFRDLEGDLLHYLNTDITLRRDIVEFGMREVSIVTKQIAKEFANDWAAAFLADPITQALSSESATSQVTEILGFNRFLTSLIGEMDPGMVTRQISDIAAYISQSVTVHTYRERAGEMRVIQVQAVNSEMVEILSQFRPGGQPDVPATSWLVALAAGQLQTQSGGKFYLSVTDIISSDPNRPYKEFFRSQGRLTRGIMVRKVPEGVEFWQSPPIDLIDRALAEVGGETEFANRVNYRLKRRLGVRLKNA